MGGERDRKKTGNVRVEDTTKPVGTEQLTCSSCLMLHMSENIDPQPVVLTSLSLWIRCVQC